MSDRWLALKTFCHILLLQSWSTKTFYKRLCIEEPVKRNKRINNLSIPLYTGCKQIICISNSLHNIERNFTVCAIEPVEIYLCLLSTKFFPFGSKAASVYDGCCNILNTEVSSLELWPSYPIILKRRVFRWLTNTNKQYEHCYSDNTVCTYSKVILFLLERPKNGQIFTVHNRQRHAHWRFKTNLF